MVEPLSLQLILAQQLNHGLQAIVTPSVVNYQLRWGRNPKVISYICDFNPDFPLGDRQWLAKMALIACEQPWGMPQVSWLQVLSGHCLRQILPSGQILFTPTPLALGAWLWQLAIRDKDFQISPQGNLPVRLAPPDLSLAQRLQLSPKAVVQYTYGRCRQLLTGLELSLEPTVGGDQFSPVGFSQRLLPINSGESVLRGLVQTVDCLTLCPRAQGDQSEPYGFAAAYRLSVAIDEWLGSRESLTAAPSTLVLLKGIDRVLGAVCQTELGLAPTAGQPVVRDQP